MIPALVVKKEESWRPTSNPMIYYSDDDDDEGLVHSPVPFELSENCRSTDPMSVDFSTWKREVGSLIRSENHVLMHNDNELRTAITKAMFLETASENLLNKRKRQLQILDECRVEEGVVGKKLFEETRAKLKRKLGPTFTTIENKLESEFHRASLPIDAPDISRPPPSLIPLPPMHIPPPSVFLFPPSSSASATSSTTSVTSAMAKAMIAPPRAPLPLMSQHLLPPPVASNKTITLTRDFSRSGQKKDVKRNEGKHEHESKTTESLARGDQSTSWRKPFHPIPIPPPKILPFLNSSLPPPFLPKDAAIPHRNFTGSEISSSSSHSDDSTTPPGFVGINVRGLFVGNRRRRLIRAFEKSPRSHQ